jgi:hypothetical protein
MKKSEFRQYIKVAREEEIEPSVSVKNRLDKAFRLKRKRTGLQIPMYQSIAAAVLFLLAGVGVGRLFEGPQPVVQRLVEVVKYVDRPVKEIQYIKVQVPSQPILATNSASVAKDSVPVSAINNSRDMDLAVVDINRVQAGISMGDDTILQKMLVTIY